MEYAKEIVEANTGMKADAVVVVYDEGLDNVIDSIRPLMVDGVEKNISATDIIRENDAYNGYPGNENVQGNMSRGDAVMELAKALSQAAKDPTKKTTMVQKALDEYAKGNICCFCSSERALGAEWICEFALHTVKPPVSHTRSNRRQVGKSYGLTGGNQEHR